jgi:hypothetical protein
VVAAAFASLMVAFRLVHVTLLGNVIEHHQHAARSAAACAYKAIRFPTVRYLQRPRIQAFATALSGLLPRVASIHSR